MRFPASDRVKYERNPLVEVICQLRFPRILRIETESPVAFQERVRHLYPLLNVGQSVDLQVPSSPPVSTAALTLSQGQPYEFLSREDGWKLTLASDFLALSTANYQRWEEFRERLQFAIDLVMEFYNPSHFTRIGLRYQDIIFRADLGLQNRPWSELLKAPLVGILAAEELPADDFQEVLSLFSCQLDAPDAFARVRYGLAKKTDRNEVGYLIDADFFFQAPTEVRDVTTTLDSFNREAGNLFRWCLTRELHEALGPQLIRE